MMSYKNADTFINMVTFPSAAFVSNVFIFPFIYFIVVQGHTIYWHDLELFVEVKQRTPQDVNILSLSPSSLLLLSMSI